ncbi:NUMOD4 motif-containing HNH endonuclease [Bacillus cytotoxicus]|uniref:NUMOD4 motif-containing HNH endonuclease n=1 Tax=unclassified Bacillus cereus group TaxID=2750818 RepID=UPI001F55EAC7|nr:MULTISPECIES: NUMOD4 motif-containing HNH endonuclease [unclassified Bacillus cereus group]
MEDKITWLDVVGYEGLYEVSNTGLIRTHSEKTTHTVHHGIRKWKQRILKNKTPNGRNVRVSLWKDGKSKDFLVHRLVAEAFIPRVKDKTSINHIDGDPKNNHVSNLEWCNHEENNNHAFDNDLMSSNKKVILFDKNTSETIVFRSMAKASLFLGHKKGYLSREVKKGHSEIKGYEIFLKAN